jgi:hypothetical protein
MDAIIELREVAQSEQARALAVALGAAQPCLLAAAFATEGGKDTIAATRMTLLPRAVAAQGGKDNPA